MKTIIKILFISILVGTSLSCEKETENTVENGTGNTIDPNDPRSAYIGNWHFTYRDIQNEWDSNSNGFNTTVTETDYPNGKIELGSQPNTIKVYMEANGTYNEYVVENGSFPVTPGTNPSFPDGGTITDSSYYKSHGGNGGSWGTHTYETIGTKIQ